LFRPRLQHETATRRPSWEFCQEREKQSHYDDPRLFGYFFGFFFAFFFALGTEITRRSNVAIAGLALPTGTKFCRRKNSPTYAGS
jgi:hypothetical protein